MFSTCKLHISHKPVNVSYLHCRLSSKDLKGSEYQPVGMNSGARYLNWSNCSLVPRCAKWQILKGPVCLVCTIRGRSGWVESAHKCEEEELIISWKRKRKLTEVGRVANPGLDPWVAWWHTGLPANFATPSIMKELIISLFIFIFT